MDAGLLAQGARWAALVGPWLSPGLCILAAVFGWHSARISTSPGAEPRPENTLIQSGDPHVQQLGFNAEFSASVLALSRAGRRAGKWARAAAIAALLAAFLALPPVAAIIPGP